MLVLSGVDEDSRRQLRMDVLDRQVTSALHYAPDLDHGLEWCEEQLLQELPRPSLAQETSVLLQICSRLTRTKERTIFMGYLERRRVPAEYCLLKQGDESNDLFFVETGTVSIHVATQKGSRTRLRRSGPGTVVGELGFYAGVARSATATTDSATPKAGFTTSQMV